MKKITTSILLFAVAVAADAGTPLRLADPTILADNGRYYIYGTSPNADEGFDVFVSDDLCNWKVPEEATEGKCLKKGEAFGERGFWAPQVVRLDSVYYMLYTADEQIAVAVSSRPTGPFVNDGKPLAADTRRIDPFLFRDSDGQNYLYHVRLDGQNKICCSTSAGCFSECITAEPGTWEDTANAEWRVAEGPTVIEQGGKYHMFYSANDFRNPDYAVGHATSDTPLGPWAKAPSPVISRATTGYSGTGHGDVFTDNSGKMRYVFHAHASEKRVGPRQTLIITLSQLPDGSFSADRSSIIAPVLVE